MKIFHTNDRFMAHSYADMINVVLGTNFTSYQESGVLLNDFGLKGVIAWFAFMDGSEHGYKDDYKWVNILSGNTIKEKLVSKDHKYVAEKFDREGYYPYRLAFEICEHGEAANNGRHSCRFVGAYTFSNFLRKDLTSRLFVKVSDDFILGSKGDFGKILNKKEDFIKGMPKLYTPIESMGFTPETLRILKSGKIANAGDLLDLGIDCKGAIVDEIHKKLYEFFGEEDKEETDLSVKLNAHFPRPPKQVIMPVPNIYEGMAVSHKIYGDGKIVKTDDMGKYIKVAFSDFEKQFAYPDCFAQGYLRAK